MKITATLSRDGRFWLVHVPEVDQYTQGRSVREAREMAIDLTATWLDIPVESVELGDVHFNLPQDVYEDIAQAGRLRTEAERANRESAQAIRHAARTMHEDGLSVRDIGSVLGVSFQRAGQLIKQG